MGRGIKKTGNHIHFKIATKISSADQRCAWTGWIFDFLDPDSCWIRSKVSFTVARTGMDLNFVFAERNATGGLLDLQYSCPE